MFDGKGGRNDLKKRMVRRIAADAQAGGAGIWRRVRDGCGVLRAGLGLSAGSRDPRDDLRCVRGVRDVMKKPCETCQSREACIKNSMGRKCGAWKDWFRNSWDKMCELARKQWGYWNIEDEL